MKSIIKIVCVLLAFFSFGCKTSKTDIPFTSYNHYFVKNTFDIDKDGNYLQIRNLESFNAIFGSATTMQKQTWIQPDDFKGQMAIAVIKDFQNNLYTLNIVKVTKEGADLRVDYEFLLKEKDLTYASTGSSLVLIEKQSYNSIMFYENGKFVKQLDNK